MQKLSPKFLTISNTMKIFLLQYSNFMPYQKYTGIRYIIGYGHYLSFEEGEYNFPVGLTEEEAYNLFIDEIGLYENDIRTNININLTQYQFDALVSLSYSINFLNFSIINSINTENFNVNMFLDYVVSDDNLIKGIFGRRQQEMNIFNGNYPTTITRIKNSFNNTRETMKDNAIRLIKRRYPLLETKIKTKDIQLRQARESYFRMTGLNLR